MLDFQRSRRSLAGTILLATLAACARDSAVTGPSGAKAAREGTSENPAGAVVVCKKGGPAGTYSFHVDIAGGGDWTLNPDATVEFDGVTMACAFMGTQINEASWATNPTATVTVTEVNLTANQQVDSIEVYNSITGQWVTPTIKNTATATQTFAYGDIIWFKYFNSIIENRLGNQGCTPGYWKQQHHFDSWVTYSPAQLLSTVFNIPASYTVKNKPMAGYTMVQGLTFQGGSTVSGKAEILIRAGVAALLNTQNDGVMYAQTSADVINAVNAALASGDKNAMIDLAAKLDKQNNGIGGCPLN